MKTLNGCCTIFGAIFSLPFLFGFLSGEPYCLFWFAIIIIPVIICFFNWRSECTAEEERNKKKYEYDEWMRKMMAYKKRFDDNNGNEDCFTESEISEIYSLANRIKEYDKNNTYNKDADTALAAATLISGLAIGGAAGYAAYKNTTDKN